MHQQSTCSVCYGTGKIVKEEDKCTICNGSGKIEKEESINFTLKRGMAFLGAIQKEGQGNCGKLGGPYGDLLIHLFIEPHNVFKTTGRDINLHVECCISASEAALGCQKEIPTIHKNTVIVDLPPGTENGFYIQKPMYGLHDMNGNVGDLYISFVVKTTKIDNEDKKELILKLNELEKNEVISENNNIDLYLKRLKENVQENSDIQQNRND